MYIIQMADLHIGASAQTEPKEADFVKQSIELIKEKIPKHEQVLLCLCGDIIDSCELNSDAESQGRAVHRYTEAEKLITEYQETLQDDYQIKVRCCPGNHDITHGEAFRNFILAVDEELTLTGDEWKSCYAYEVPEENSFFIFVNSCDGDQYKIGKVDFDKLEQLLREIPKGKNKVIILHHTIMSMFDDDASPIRNAARLVNLVERYDVSTVLHGHIHGREILKVAQNQCKVIGTGALFTRNNPNVNSQFNIIHYCKGEILEIQNCRYNADGGRSPWDIRNLVNNTSKVLLEGESFQEVYEKLMDRLSIESVLYDVALNIQCSYDDFARDLHEYLKDDRVKLGEKNYDYFQLAEMWQREDVPEELYFNHGSKFKVNGQSGIHFVVEQLKKKPSSNRIVLPTYNMADVYNSLDDSEYLPSLESIQFGRGRTSDELMVHMHLRALEAGRFLKINICEIAYILDELKKKSVEFDKIYITISAFRVQTKDKFNCFLKAEIDNMNPIEIAIKAALWEKDELCKLLQEKRDGQETISKVHGLKTLYQAMKTVNKEGKGSVVCYSEDIITKTKEILSIYEKLDRIHKSTSIHSQAEKTCEKKIDSLLGELIETLGKMSNSGKEQ